MSPTIDTQVEVGSRKSGKSRRTSIAVAICTYNRHDALTVLLTSLLVSSSRVFETAAVGVVIVDDSIDGNACLIAKRFEDKFELGVTYRVSGRQNISLARNLAIETASRIGDWTAMTDDDCEASPDWLKELLNTQERTAADAVTGPMIRRVPAGSPSWLTDEPFLQLGQEKTQTDDERLPFAATFNSMISSKWIIEHPGIRFEPSLGVVGGEDMVFYRTAHAAGLRIYYSKDAAVYENEPPSRATLAYQLRLFYWHGNSSYITSVQNGVRPTRMFLNGTNSLRRALARPIHRLIHGQKPQLRYCLASSLHAVGKMMGILGIRVTHE
jgi:succinoglycan biosynthesis protein ExoM